VLQSLQAGLLAAQTSPIRRVPSHLRASPASHSSLGRAEHLPLCNSRTQLALPISNLVRLQVRLPRSQTTQPKALPVPPLLHHRHFYDVRCKLRRKIGSPKLSACKTSTRAPIAQSLQRRPSILMQGFMSVLYAVSTFTYKIPQADSFMSVLKSMISTT
jgi:hypothetical protein